jgi:stalled ribosome alternative rescue factor ArfA
MRLCYTTSSEYEEVTVRNVQAKALENPIFRQRKIAARKGKGAYTRRDKHANKQHMDVR